MRENTSESDKKYRNKKKDKNPKNNYRLKRKINS